MMTAQCKETPVVTVAGIKCNRRRDDKEQKSTGNLHSIGDALILLQDEWVLAYISHTVHVFHL